MTYRLLIPRTFWRWLTHRVGQGIALALGAACLLLAGLSFIAFFWLGLETIP